MFFILDKLLCVIICFILITKQLILCGYCKENWHTDKLVGAERVKRTYSSVKQQLEPELC